MTQHDRWTTVPPELVQVGSKYTFTLNPKEQHFGRECRFNFMYKHIFNILQCLHSCDYVLYPEISKLGRIHYHGTIVINDVVEFYVYDIPFLMDRFTFEIDTITDDDKWTKYMTKQQAIMEPYAKTNKTPYKLDSKVLKRLIYEKPVKKGGIIDQLMGTSGASP